jgi:hypothetical protein
MGDPQRAVDGIRAKVARGLEHLLALDEKLHAYQDTDPLDLHRQVQADGETSIFTLHVTTPPPLELSVMVGDVVHQLRSAVDHIANSLVLAAGNTPTSRTVFPVLLEPPPGGLRVIGGVTDEALAAVAEVQPYQRQSRREEHPMWVLHRLANVDKHRNLHLTVLQVLSATIHTHRPSRGDVVVGGELQARPIGDDDVIGVFRFRDEGIPLDTELIAGGLTFLAFGEPGPWPSDEPFQQVLERLLEYVSLLLVPKFEPLILGG